MQARVFLFLQGPNCGFFSGIARKLEQLGHTCLKVNFCAGDYFFWRHAGAINYREPLKNWESFIEQLLIEKKITTIVLYGDKRPYHQIAIEVATKLGITTVVTDYGYLRPGFLIFEKNGIGAQSLFSKKRETLELLAASAASKNGPKQLSDHWLRKIILLSTGTLLTSLFSFRYPHYCKPITNHPFILGIGFCFQFLRKFFFAPKTNHTIHQLAAASSRNPYFLYPLQIDMDFQIRTSVRYFDQSIALREVMTSFARHADPHARLVIKIHPLDPGLRPWKELVTAMAYEKGILERVFFLYGGSLNKLLTHCSGVVTINSTVGLQALQFGKRVKSLDEAIYNIPGLIYSGTLDSFWKSQEGVDKNFCQIAVTAIASTLQIEGTYFSRHGLKLAIDQAAERLEKNSINQVVL